MKPGQWFHPAHTGDDGVGDGRRDKVIVALAEALAIPPAQQSGLSVDAQRLAGRSDIHVVRAVPPGTGGPWAVKQPHPEWYEANDLGGPLPASDEFLALRRLHDHFEQLHVPCRVPTPVAYLPTLDAFAMEYVEGVSIKDMLAYTSAGKPAKLVAAMGSAGFLLRQLHTLDAIPSGHVDLRAEADQVLELELDRLVPRGLALPEAVRGALARLPDVSVPARQVRLHGDFGPGNVLLAEDGSTVVLDPTLSAVGTPEHDVARFLTLLSGIIRFAPELVAPPVAAVRRKLEGAFLLGYYESTRRPALLELAYLQQLVPRWCRLRELTERDNRNVLMSMRLRVIDAQMRRLMEESGRRLWPGLGQGFFEWSEAG